MTQLPITREQIEAIELGARYCRTLAAVQRAYMLEDTDDLEAILANLDPTEVSMTANALTAIHRVWDLLLQARGGTTISDVTGSPRQRLEPTPLRRDTPAERTPQATVPFICHDIDESAGMSDITYLDPWSRKSPPSQ